MNDSINFIFATQQKKGETLGKFTRYLQQHRYEKQKAFWRTAIMNGEKYYNEYDREWEPIPTAVFTLFTDNELHMIYIERDRQKQDLLDLMEQLE